MSFWTSVLHFLRQTRILNRINAFVERHNIPNLTFLFLVTAFPLFQLLKHSTLWLLPMCLFLLLQSLKSFLEEPKIDFADFLVLLILLLQISKALIGYGRAIDALTAALLTSIWFFARRFWSEANEKVFAFFSSISLLIVSAIGVGQYALGMAEVRWVDASRFGDIGGRVTSIFSNPNILAVYLVLYFPLSLWATFSPKNNVRMRVFYAISAAFGGVCILLTWSRGAWLALFLELFLFLLLCSSKTRRLLFFSPLLLLAVPLLPNNVKGRLYSIGDLGESSIRYRLQTWQGTWQMLAAHPFGIGVGERAWRAIYPHFAVSGTGTVMHAHNVFLQVATELGFVGLIVFSILLGKAFLSAFKRKNFMPLAAVAGALVMGSFDHLWYYPGMLVPFFAFLSLCAPCEQKATQKSRFVDILHEK